jgi:ferritin heavy chain
MSKVSQCRQNFHEESEATINKQINMELTASYVYQAMAMHCDRDDVALPNTGKFFKDASDEEREHAEKLMKYQNMRGGRIVYQDIKKPEISEFGGVVEMLALALKLERDVNHALLELHAVADKHGDKQMTDFIEGEFLEEQVKAIKELGDLLTRARKCGHGLGEFMFDKEAFE